MIFTLVLSVMMMAGLFLMLWSAVGFIQDKRFMTTAPKEVLAVVPDRKPQRFKGQYALGYFMAGLSIFIMLAPIIIGAWDGIRHDFTFGQFFLRFTIMHLLLKAFDIGFFDWVLLCNGGFGFFAHYYPEVKHVYKRDLFGYNWKEHLTQILVGIAAAALLAWICTLI